MTVTVVPNRPTGLVLDVRDLTVRYGQDDTVCDVAFQLRAGETVALVGGSGAGKSTVAKAIAGLVTARSGSVVLATADQLIDVLGASRPQRRRARRSVHLVMQDPYASLPPHRRILDIVMEPLVIHRLSRRGEREALAREALASVGLDPARYEQRLPRELSGGQRQRVAFSRAIVTRPAVILADEPTGMLDATLRAEVSLLMSDLATQHGTAILHITHDLGLAARTCDRVIVMCGGRIVEAGSTASVLADPQHRTTQDLLAAALRGSRHVRPARVA